MTQQIPGAWDLLRTAGQGDRAAFAALYDSLAPRAHGMAAVLFPHGTDAVAATQAAFAELWVQAPHFSFNFSTDASDTAARNRTVDAWAIGVIQSTLAQRFRHPLAPVQQGTEPRAAEAEEIFAVANRLPELNSLTEAQRHAISLAWLGARDLSQLSQQLGSSIPTLKSRLRDASSRLVRAYLAAVTGEEDVTSDPLLARPVTPEVTARTGIAVTFSDDIQKDVENGLADELAATVVLNVLPEEDSVRIDSWLSRQTPEKAAQWRSRTGLLQLMLAWAFRRVVLEPPHDVLERTLNELPEQNVGIGFMDDFDDVEVETRQTQPTSRRTMFIVILIALLVAAGVAIWSLTGGDRSIVKTVDNADDVYTSSPQDMTEGGTIQSKVSASEGQGYLSVSGAPSLDEDKKYQVWLLTDQGATPVSAGLYDAEELNDEQARFQNLSDYSFVWITIEPESGSETPSGEVLAEVPLRRS